MACYDFVQGVVDILDVYDIMIGDRYDLRAYKYGRGAVTFKCITNSSITLIIYFIMLIHISFLSTSLFYYYYYFKYFFFI